MDAVLEQAGEQRRKEVSMAAWDQSVSDVGVVEKVERDEGCGRDNHEMF